MEIMSDTHSGPPTHALHVDLTDLLSGLVYMAGGVDRIGLTMITIPTSISVDDSGIKNLTQILKYYVHVAQEDVDFEGCAVFMDLIDTDVESRVCILLALQEFKAWYTATVDSKLNFHFVIAQSLSSSQLTAVSGLVQSCVGHHILVFGYKDLEQYVTKTERTEDLRGTQLFDLDSWVQWRFTIEPFFADCASCKRRAPERLDALKQADIPKGGNVRAYTEELLKLKLDTLINEGAILMQRLDVQPKDPVKAAMANSNQFLQAQDKISGLNNMLRELRQDLARACGLDLEHDDPKDRDMTGPSESESLLSEAQRVSDWICRTGLSYLSNNCQNPGYTIEECRSNMDSFKTFCSQHADGYISRAVKVTEGISSADVESADAVVKEEAEQLRSLVATFQSSLAEWQDRIQHAMDWHTIAAEVMTWSAQCLEMLVSPYVTDDDLTAEEVIHNIDAWLQDHPPPKSEKQQQLTMLAFALQRHNFFSSEAVTVRDAQGQAETQLQNHRNTAYQRIQMAQFEQDIRDGGTPDFLPAMPTTPPPGSQASNLIRPVPVRSPAVQEKIDEFFDEKEVRMGRLVNPDYSYDSEDESFVTAMDITYASSPDVGQSPSPDCQSSIDTPLVEEDAAEKQKRREKLGQVPRMSLAEIAAAPTSPVAPTLETGDGQVPKLHVQGADGKDSLTGGDDDDQAVTAEADGRGDFADGDTPDAGESDSLTSDDPHARKARFLMDEVLSTEVKYIEDLDLCIREFLDVTVKDSSKPGLLVGKKNIIFGNIQRLHDFNNGVLLPALEALKDTPMQLGSVFVQHESGFGLYSIYFKNMPQQEELLEDCMQYFRSIQIRANDPFTLNSYLIKPFQRMTRYRQFIEGLQKHVYGRNQQEVREELRSALWIVCFHLRHGNDLLALDKLKGFDGNPAEQGMLLRQDDFTVVVNKQFRNRKRRVFLFEEMVVVAKVHPSKSKKTSEDLYFFKEGYRLGDVTLSASATERKFELCIKKHTRVTFQTEKEDVKQDWITDIQKLLYHQAKRLKERMAHISSGIEAPIFDRASWSHASMRGSRMSGTSGLLAPPSTTSPRSSLVESTGSNRMSYEAHGRNSTGISRSSISSPLNVARLESLNFDTASVNDRASVVSAATLKADDEAETDAAPETAPDAAGLESGGTAPIAIPTKTPEKTERICRETSL